MDWMTRQSLLRAAFLLFVSVILCALGPSFPQDGDPIPGFFQGSVEEAFANAQREDKVLMIEVYAPWCGYCQALEEEVYRREAFLPYTDKMVCLRVNREESHLPRSWSVPGYPTVLFFRPDRTEIDRKVGYPGRGRFLAMVESVLDRASPQFAREDRSRTSFRRRTELNREVFRLTNQRRRQHGREPLRRDATLRDVACRHSRDMIERGFFARENPDGQAPHDRVAEGHRRLVGTTGENIWSRSRTSGRGARNESARALAQSIVEGWMQSPGHRENILRPRFSHLGVCAVQTDGELRVTQLFADVRAYFEAPLPDQLPPASHLPVALRPVPRSNAGPGHYDYADPNSGTRAAGPKLFNDSLKTPDEAGQYRVRFYFPRPGGSRILPGPDLTVTAEAPMTPRDAADSAGVAARDSLLAPADTAAGGTPDSTSSGRIGW